MKELDSSVRGAIGENFVISQLLQKGFEVFMPIVDRGVDCVIKGESGNFYEIQVKTRASQGGRRAASWYFSVRAKTFSPRPNFFVACYQADYKEVWFFPSLVFNDHAHDARRGTHRRVYLSQKLRNELSQYKDGYDQFK